MPVPGCASAQNSFALAVSAPRQRHRPGKPPAQHNHATRTAPALQAKRGLDPRPALARVLPFVTRHQPLGKAAGSLRQTQLEQIVETRPLARRHVALAPPILVAPNQARPVLTPETLKQGPKRGRRALRPVAVARRDDNVQHKARRRNAACEGRPAGCSSPPPPPGGRRIVVSQSRTHGSLSSGRTVSSRWPRSHARSSAPTRSRPRRTESSLATLVAQQIDAVAAQRSDVRARLSRENREQQRPQNVALRGRVRARVVQRAVRNQRIEAPAHRYSAKNAR